MTPTLQVALIRALITGVILGGAMFFVLFGQSDDWRLIISGTGTAFFGPFVTRFGGEGFLIDNKDPIQQGADVAKTTND